MRRKRTSLELDIIHGANGAAGNHTTLMRTSSVSRPPLVLVDRLCNRPENRLPISGIRMGACGGRALGHGARSEAWRASEAGGGRLGD